VSENIRLSQNRLFWSQRSAPSFFKARHGGFQCRTTMTSFVM
jgi:hypothetical protein